jgi:predicted aspartyl protease
MEGVGRIVASVTIQNISDPAHRLRCDALVDTGASHMIVPEAWRDRLGALESLDTVELELANQAATHGEICGPVQIQIEGFRPVFTEVLFVPMEPVDGLFEPLIGYLVLEQSQAAVDVVGDRLIHVKRLDLKSGQIIARPDLLTGEATGQRMQAGNARQIY